VTKTTHTPAVSQGIHRPRDDGLEKVRDGVTSIPEMLRVLGNSAT
jgi:type II secretory ATPase GspE/PulE/Tfp pilus assembly ATPase PilB-like protein